MLFTSQLLFALVLDLIFGDPNWLPHPVRYIGWICSRTETIIRKEVFTFRLKLKGAITFLITVCIVVFSIWLLFRLSSEVHTVLTMVVAVILLYSSIAVGDLLKHSKKVYAEVHKNDLKKARFAVAMLVGRDTEAMGEEDICRGCIESVAENLVDGITAPLFWAVLFASIALLFSLEPLIYAVYGGYLYKTVNTMDSMFGYKNSKYLEFGWFAARTDDYFNFLPARISGMCVVLGAFILGLDYKRSLSVLKNERFNSSSPNSGHTEAAVAGALNRQLGGDASYFGVPTTKPLIGKGFGKTGATDILRTNKLVIVSALIFLIGCIFIYNFILLCTL